MRNNRMTRNTRRVVIFNLVFILIAILSFDAFLWHHDPLGVRVYIYSLIEHRLVMEPAPHGYTLQHGTHDFGSYTVTIGTNGNRIVSDSGQHDCTIAFIGDSVTFGLGVADSETFVNRLAHAYPTIEWRNVSRSGYNAENILDLHNSYPADGYIWLIIQNDVAPRWEGSFQPLLRLPSATELYFQYVLLPSLQNDHDGVPDTDTYFRVIEQLSEDTTFFGFDEFPANITPNVILIDKYTDTISHFDNHPDANGHAQIAAAMSPYLPDIVEQVCDA